jgi:ribosomal-protein-alanine N-acetyltransferase
MRSLQLHDATPDQVTQLARTLTAAHVFSGTDELERTAESEPWRIQVNERGDVAVLGTWRDHLPYLALEAFWCPASRSAQVIGQIRHIASARGFTDVVSPPTPVEDMHFYESAGMQVHTLVATYRRVEPLTGDLPAGQGVSLRQAEERDVTALVDVDARCFEPFWRYDLRHLERFYASARLALAERAGEVVGYTLCTLNGDEGLLGRVCVVPEARRCGIGSALVRDAVRYVHERDGHSLVLSTQTDNLGAQALYRNERFRDTGRRYAFLCFDGK